jgi:hypothetical protein
MAHSKLMIVRPYLGGAVAREELPRSLPDLPPCEQLWACQGKVFTRYDERVAEGVCRPG